MYRERLTIGEAERLALLESYAPDTLQDDAELDSITRFASALCAAPIALVSLVEADRQRFLAREGLDATETPRNVSFCQHAMLLDRVMEVPDAALDPRFADNGLVTGAPFIRFYAGAPLIGDDGEPLGALCVISPEPRAGGLTDLQREGLVVLAQAVMRRMKDRRSHIAGKASQARFEALGDAMPQMAWSTLPDGMVDYFNQRWEEFTGVTAAAHFGSGWVEALHPDDRDVALAAWSAAVDGGSPYEVEYRLRRHDGEWRWTLARGLPMKDGEGRVTRWFGTNTDIHERAILLENQDLLSRELSHRIKNIFSVVSGLLHLEARAEPGFEKVASAVSSRIGALGRAHDYVRPGGRGGAGNRTSLKGVLEELFLPYTDAGGARVAIDGDDLPVSEDAVSPLALLFHELATNAAKYGALSAPAGSVALTTQVDGDTTRFYWVERGGPDASGGAAAAGGFGARLIAMAVERQLKGAISRRWTAKGLAVEVEVPTIQLTGAHA